MTTSIIGKAFDGDVYAVEFIRPGDDPEREPGVYVTIQLYDADAAIGAGRVRVRYLPMAVEDETE